MMKYAMLLAVVLAVGCISTGNVANSTGYSTMPANQTSNVVMIGDHVFVDYVGTLENGTVFDSSEGKAPLDFNAGLGEMIPGFDKAVIGMHVGDKKKITLQPEDAYGEWDKSRVISLNRTLLPNNTYVGQTLYSSSGQQAVVLSMNETSAQLDLNHPLTGKVLIFDLTLVKIDKASK